jgi:hypothetical protein
MCENPAAIHILEQNLDKVCWKTLCRNPNAIHLIKQNIDKVDWEYLSTNPAIFTYDYKAIRQHILETGVAEELMMERFHPKNIPKFPGWGFSITFDDDE